ncbi:MAG: ABC transporter permease, partial [Rectinema subterraneum]
MDLARFLSRRLFRLVLTVLLISTIVFFVIRIIPGDPALIIAGVDAKPSDIQAIR